MTIKPTALAPAAVLLLAALVAGSAYAADVPRVRLIATGGTISNRTGGRLTAEDLARSIPDLAQHAQVESEQFANTSSSALTLDQWLQLARRVNAVFAKDRNLAGIVVTSGTDTLEELAYFLNLTVRDERPVVVVGSMRNPSTLGYEGAANLLEAIRVAAEPSARNKGVLVVLNDEINAARDVTKTDALRLETFQSRPYGVLGIVDSDRVTFYREVLKRHTARSEFDVSEIASLPRVDVVLTYQGAPADLIKAAADNGAKGIVVAGAGAGATSGTQGEGLAYAAEKGVVLVTATRTGSGRVAARRPAPAVTPQAGLARAGVTQDTRALQAALARARRRIAAEDLAPIKARILLMLALTRTEDPDAIQRMFIEY